MNRAADEDKLLRTFYVVEATNQECHQLWVEWSGEALRHGWGTPSNKRIAWEQDPMGFAVLVGNVADHPVNLALTWARIGGQWVLFWEMISRVTDSELAEAWLTQHVPAYASRRTNATNFGHCLSACRDAGGNMDVGRGRR